MARRVIARLTLPVVARDTVTARRSRATPRAPLPLAGGQITVGAVPDGTVPFLTEATTAEVAWGDARIGITCAPELVLRILRQLDGELQVAALDPDLLGLLSEAAVLPNVVALENRSGRNVRCLRVAPAMAFGIEPALWLVFDDGERRWPVVLRSDAAVLAEALQAWPVRPQPWSDLPITLRARIGATRLPLRLVRSLAPADTVLFEDRPDHAGVVVIAESRIAQAEAQGSAWRLREAPHPARLFEEEWVMGREDEPPDAEEHAGDLDDIPVRLSFDVGQTAMPLGEVRRLGPGAVIETGRRTDDLVRISANGRLVGHGTLVDIEGRVGVEIVRLFDHG